MRDSAIYAQIAAIHIGNIDRGFLSQLGERFLALLYRAMDEETNTMLIVEQSQDRVVGFVSGGTGLGPVYRALLHRFPALFGALLPARLSPKKLYRGLCDHFEAAGVPAFRIVVGQSLYPAHAFYRPMGAQPTAEVHVHGGALSTVYVQLLDVPSHSEGSVELRGHRGDSWDRF